MIRRSLPALLALALGACAQQAQGPDPSVMQLVEQRRAADLDARAAEQQYTDRLQRMLDAESRDARWADRFEDDLRRAADGVLPQGTLSTVDCRATRCMVEFAPAAAADRQQAQDGRQTAGAPGRLPASAGLIAWLSAAQPCGFYAPAPSAIDPAQPLRTWILCEDDRGAQR